MMYPYDEVGKVTLESVADQVREARQHFEALTTWVENDSRGWNTRHKVVVARHHLGMVVEMLDEIAQCEEVDGE